MSLFHIKAPVIYKPGDSITKLMFSRVTRQISGTFMHIFSAVYIYRIMQSLGYEHSYSLMFVFFYYFLAFFVKAVVLFMAQYISSNFGFKNTIRLSVVPYTVYVLLLFVGGNNLNMFILASVFAGINAGLYWWGYHGYFVKKGQKGHFGTAIGEMNVLETSANVLTPLAGAFVISLLGFKSLFLISLLFVYLSAMLLGKGSRTRQKHNISPTEVLNLLDSHKYTAFAYIGLGAESVIASIAWPLFLYLFFGQVISLGITVTTAAFLAAVFSMIIGAKVDTSGGISIVKAGSIILFATWIIKFLSRGLGAFVLSDSLGNFGRSMVSLPLNTLSYRKALEAETAKAILFFETAQIIGTLSMLILIAVLTFTGRGLEISFIFASLFSLMPLVWALRRQTQ